MRARPTNNDAAPTSQPIDIDLPCVKCGYNLRTLAGTATCTECGTPVAQSTLLPGFRFRSRRAARRVRLGSAVLVISMLIWALTQLAFWFVCRFSMQIQDTGWAPALASVWGYGLDASLLLRNVAVLTICLPFGPGHCCAHRWLGLAASLLALLASVGLIAYRVFDLGAALLTAVFSLSWVVCAHGLMSCTAMAILLLLLFMARRLSRPTMRHLAKLLRVAIGAAVVELVLSITDAVSSVSWLVDNVKLPWSTSSPMFLQMYSISAWATEHVLPFCWPVILLAVGLYYRRLNLALRLPQDDRIR